MHNKKGEGDNRPSKKTLFGSPQAKPKEHHFITRDRFDEDNNPTPHKFPGHRDTKSKEPGTFRKYIGSLTTKKYVPLRIIPTGGVDEVGGNSTIFEHGKDMIVVDCGMLFTTSELPGSDYIIPDLSYVQRFKGQFHGIVITHGHLDHIGSLSHILPKLNFPMVYAPKLAIGIMQKHFKEKGITRQMEKRVIEYNGSKPMHFGSITVDAVRVDHSIQDGFGLFIQTPAGTVFHGGDFRIDPECMDKYPADIQDFIDIGNRGVDVLMTDSTNATIPGSAKTEKVVADTFDEEIARAKGRVIIATFSTLSTRISNIIKSAQKHGRTVFINGRSMIENTTLARDLGFIDFKRGTVKKMTNKVNELPDNQVLVITTGTQAEPMAGLTRIAMGSHPFFAAKEGDLLIRSGRIFPEAEGKVLKLMNIMMEKGVEVLFKYNCGKPFHTSGHAWSEDIKQMIGFMKPKHHMPIHGELFMRTANKNLGIEMGVPAENNHLVDNGDCLELYEGKVKVKENYVKLKDVLVEKGREGEITDPMIFERITLRDNGILIIMFKVDKSTRKLKSRPKLISRGFVFKGTKEKVTKEMADRIAKIYNTHARKGDGQKKQKELVGKIRWEISKYIGKVFDKQPIIVPLIIED